MSDIQTYAVLTGDIVASSQRSLEGQRLLPEVVHRVSREVKEHFEEAFHSEIDVFRGDSWQMVIIRPKDALRIGCFIRSRMRSEPSYRHLDSRISIGIGAIDYLPENNVSTGNGQAFRLSGEGLESLPSYSRMSLTFPNQHQAVLPQALNVIVQLMDLQMQRWTGKQAEAVSGALINLTQKEIATSWVREPVTQQAISQHLEGAGWVQMKSGLSYVERVIPRMLNSGKHTST